MVITGYADRIHDVTCSKRCHFMSNAIYLYSPLNIVATVVFALTATSRLNPDAARDHLRWDGKGESGGVRERLVRAPDSRLIPLASQREREHLNE